MDSLSSSSVPGFGAAATATAAPAPTPTPTPDATAAPSTRRGAAAPNIYGIPGGAAAPARTPAAPVAAATPEAAAAPKPHLHPPRRPHLPHHGHGHGPNPADPEAEAAAAEAAAKRAQETAARKAAARRELDEAVRATRPRDAAEGLASGLSAAAAGIAAGVVGLFAAPIAGARHQGAKGFAKGVAAGVAGVVVLPVAGVVGGAVQAGRGLANQAEATREKRAGKVWDKERKEWADPPGTALQPFDADEAARRARLSAAPPPVDYYALLEVSRDATPEQIKRAYYVLARKHHPDKNRTPAAAGDGGASGGGGNGGGGGNDGNGPEDATAKFQRLGEAYQVLSDPQARQRYDRFGAVPSEFVDAATVFGALFGSDLFAPLVGEFMIVTATARGFGAAGGGGGDGTGGPSREEEAAMEAIQVARVAKLAASLRRKLEPHVQGEREAFAAVERCNAEALAAASFGGVMLDAIGCVYGREGRLAASGNVFERGLVRLKRTGASVGGQFAAAKAAVALHQHQQQLQTMDERMRAAAAAIQVRREGFVRRRTVRGEGGRRRSDGETTAFFLTRSPQKTKQHSSRQTTNPRPPLLFAPEIPQHHQEAAGRQREAKASEDKGKADEAAAAAAAAHAAAAGAPEEKVLTPLPEGEVRAFLQALSEQRAEAEAQGARLALAAMWAANIVDLQRTLHSVCKQVRPPIKKRGERKETERKEGARAAAAAPPPLSPAFPSDPPPPPMSSLHGLVAHCANTLTNRPPPAPTKQNKTTNPSLITSKVLKEPGVDRETLRARAAALVDLSKIYRAAESPDGQGGKDEALKRMAEMMSGGAKGGEEEG